MSQARNPLRLALTARVPPQSGFPLLVIGTAALAIAGWRIAAGTPRQAGIAAIVGGVLLLCGVAAGVHGRWRGYLAFLIDAVADVLVLGPLAWPLRLVAPWRLGGAVVSALGCVFVSAYAEARAEALGTFPPRSPVGAPERAIVVGAGLLAFETLEWVLWLIAAVAFASALRTTVFVWKQVR